MSYARISLFVLCQAIWIAGCLDAQPASPAPLEPARAPQQETTVATGAKPRTFPVEVAGYLSFRYLNDDALDDRRFYREYTGSLFLSKTIGRWRFHSELNATSWPEYDSDGIHIFPARPSLSVKLDSASLNYTWRDWLQGEVGFLFVPTYWRTHRYQSTTLTVDEPLPDQNVFPTAFKGARIHGDRYFEDGGLSYEFYGGAGQQTEFPLDSRISRIEQSHVAGGKLVIHLPSRHFFDDFDIGFHRLHKNSLDGERDEVYGGEMRLDKDRLGFLGEIAHASKDIFDGKRAYITQGYYLQTSYRLTRKLFAVARYDQLNRDSRYARENALARTTAGLTYRPVQGLSLKIDADRYEPQAGRMPSYYGATMGVVYFFRLP